MRCWFRCRRADWEPGFLGKLFVERGVAGMTSIVHRSEFVVKKLTQERGVCRVKEPASGGSGSAAEPVQSVPAA